MIHILHLWFELQSPEGCLHNGEGKEMWKCDESESREQLKAGSRSCNNVCPVGDEVKTSLIRDLFLSCHWYFQRTSSYLGISHVYMLSYYRHPLLDLSDPRMLGDQKDWTIFALHWHQLPCRSGWIYLPPGMLAWYECDVNSACVRYFLCVKAEAFLGEVHGT